MPRKKNNKIICEKCDTAIAVIIDKKIYYCPECYMFDNNIPFENAIYNLKIEGLLSKKTN
jgi:protein-arginine kinase activator protein McsA